MYCSPPHSNDFGHDSGAAWEAAFTSTYVAFVANATTRDPTPTLAALGILPIQNGGNAYVHKPGMDPESGKRGCFFSHKHMIETFVTSQAPLAIFFEDDIVLSPHRDEGECLSLLKRRELSLARQRELQPACHTGIGIPSPSSPSLDDEWDMLLLGYGPNTSPNWSFGRRRRTFRVSKFWGMHAYVLTQAGAAKVLAMLEWKGVDIDRQISAQSAGLCIAALHPSLMYQSAAPSTILPPALRRARQVLFKHNNGITAHRTIEVCTAYASFIVFGVVFCLLMIILTLIVCKARGARRAVM